MHVDGKPLPRRSLLTWALGPPLCAALATGLTVHVRAAPPAAASAPVPDTRAIIDALLPTQTRSARNLLVRPKPEAAADAASAPAPPAAAASSPAGPPPSLALAIQFEPNSARVKPESGPVLGSLVAAMQSPELKASRFVIEGHADARGAAAQNQRLSQERADEVRLYLVALGVHPARLRAVGKGASQLADANDPAAAANRRVRVVTLE